MKKKILFIVAGKQQLPAIQYARERGYYIITCDNDSFNPGHELANENLNISAYDKEEIFKRVENSSIDAVVNFISAHGLESSAFIAEKFGLEGIKPQTLFYVNNKYRFREFLRTHSFNVPKYNTSENFFPGLDESLNYPLVIKPVDRGGNVGVNKVEKKEELERAFHLAKEKSLSGKVIIEEFISGDQRVNGDFLVINNKIVYSLVGDYFYDEKVNPILPYATTFPTKADTSSLKEQLEKILEILDFGSGIFNLEVFITNNRIYFIEFNARHSGNLIYKLMSEDTGKDFAEISVELALGKKYNKIEVKESFQNLAYCILNTSKSGIIEKLEISEAIEDKIIEKIMFKNCGDRINGFQTLHDRLGLLLMKFDSQEEMVHIVSNITDFYKVYLKESSV